MSKSKSAIFICVAGIVAALCIGQAIHAQTAPAFEVASVKPTDQNARMGCTVFTYPGGRMTVYNCTLRYIIAVAFHNDLYQFPGKPGWVDGDRFDIEAKPPASSASSKANPLRRKDPPNDEQRLMLQALLEDRFKLAFHRETKDAPVYLLVRGNKQLLLKEPKDKLAYPWAGCVNGGVPFGDGMRGENINMPQMAERLTKPLGRPVLDRTGLSGSYDFKFEYPPEDSQHPDVVAAILASTQGIGLKLEASKAPIDTVVIDHVEKPTPN